MKKNTQRVITFIMALMLVFNIYVPKSKAFAAEAAATTVVLSEVLKWLGITAAGAAVGWGTNEALNALFGDTVPTNQPTQSYYTGAVNPISRPTIYNPQAFNTTNTTNTTNNTKIVNTYNKTITTINHTTNNYEIKNYETINYNSEYNMYYTQIENKNYYITYAPTYTNITYIDSHATSAGEAYSYNLYYQLPDGRNSYDLDADDIWGTVFISDFVNYNNVPEDDGQTLALYHFDGNTKDSSANNGTSSYITGASYQYVDSGNFNSALFWNNNEHNLQINLPYDIGTNDVTIEMRVYTALSNITQSYKIYFPSGVNTTTYDTYVNGVKITGGTGNYFIGNTNTIGVDYYYDIAPVFQYCKVELDDDIVVKNKSNGAVYASYPMGCYFGQTAPTPPVTAIYKVSPFILFAGDKPLLNMAYKNGEATYSSTTPTLYTSYKFITEFPTNTLPTEYSMNIGQWSNITYVRTSGVGKLYYNGQLLGNAPISTIGNKINLKINSGFVDYLYLDELRVSKGALYLGDYVPSSAPFDTNLVYVLPSNPVEDRIAIKSNIPINKNRIGGVRPTYPTKGYVYISLDGTNKVDSIQQFNGAEWVDTDGAIYKGGIWRNLDKFDMSSYILDENDFPDYNDANIIGKNNIVYMLSNLSVNSGVSTIADGETYHVTLSSDTGYTLPDTVQVVMDMQELAAGTGYTYTNGEITVPNVTGDLYVSAAGQSDGTGTYNVSYALTNMMLSNQQHTETGITATFQVAEKFDMPTSIKVMMGETELSPITGYTFTGGVLTVPSVTDSVLVVAAAKVNENAVTPTPTPTTTPPPGGGSGTDFTGIIDFFTGLLSSIVNGVSSILSSITTILNSLTGVGTGFVNFLSRSFSFIPAEIVSIYALGVGVMIILAIIKMLRG